MLEIIKDIFSGDLIQLMDVEGYICVWMFYIELYCLRCKYNTG